MPVTEAHVSRAMESVYDPCSMATGTPLNVMEMGLVRRVECHSAGVRITMCATTPSCVLIASIMEGVHDAVAALPDVGTVDVDLDAEVFWTPQLMQDAAREGLEQRRTLLTQRFRGSRRQPTADRQARG